MEASASRPAGVVEFPGLQPAGRLVGRTRRGRRGRRRGVSFTPRVAMAGWSGASWRPGATRTVSTRTLRLVGEPDLGTLDLRGEAVAEHLRAVAAASLGGVVLSGTVDGMAGAERGQLLTTLGTRLAPGGTLVIHSVTRQAWEGADAPPEADLAAGRPLRPDTWCSVLGQSGYEAVAHAGPGGNDFLVVAIRSAITSPYEPAGR